MLVVTVRHSGNQCTHSKCERQILSVRAFPTTVEPAAGFKEHHQKALESWQEEAAAAAGFSSGSDNDSNADPDADQEAGYSGSDGSADTSEPAQQRSDGSASPAAEALDAIERSADTQSSATQSGGGGAAAAAGAADERGKSSCAMPAVAAGEAAAPGGDGDFQAVQAQLSGGSGSDGGVASSSDGDGGAGFSDGEESEAWERGTAAASSVTGTARSRRRRQTPVGPQDVQRRVTALRQVGPCFGTSRQLAAALQWTPSASETNACTCSEQRLGHLRAPAAAVGKTLSWLCMASAYSCRSCFELDKLEQGTGCQSHPSLHASRGLQLCQVECAPRIKASVII